MLKSKKEAFVIELKTKNGKQYLKANGMAKDILGAKMFQTEKSVNRYFEKTCRKFDKVCKETTQISILKIEY